MNTLNYWLGKLQRMQLFGHGTKSIQVSCDRLQELFEVIEVRELDGVVYIEVN